MPGRRVYENETVKGLIVRALRLHRRIDPPTWAYEPSFRASLNAASLPEHHYSDDDAVEAATDAIRVVEDCHVPMELREAAFTYALTHTSQREHVAILPGHGKPNGPVLQ